MTYKMGEKVDRVTIFTSLGLIFLYCATLDSYADMPFRYDYNSTGNNSEVPVDIHETAFESVFYIGKGLGSMAAGGLLAYISSPEAGVKLSTGLSVATGLLSACLSEVANTSAALTYLIWFWIPFFQFAHIIVRFIHTLESIDDKWINYVGMGLFGLNWSLGRLYAIMATEYFPDWHYRILITSTIFSCLTALQATVPLKRVKPFKSAHNEHLQPLTKSKLAVRYFAILMLLWMIHGANAKYVYKQTTKTQLFVCLGNAVSKVMVTFLCSWTGQKRAVMAVLLALNSILCFCFTAFGMTLCQGPDYKYEECENQDVVASLDQVWTFLNTGSLCILWLWTVQIYGCGSRYIALGAGSLACRLGALLAIYSVDVDRYLGWPSGILGALCMVSVFLCFLLPEPKRTGLPIRTRKISDKKCNNAIPSVE